MSDSLAAIHTKESFFTGVFARLLPRLEAKGAAWAVAHRIAKVVWLLLHEGVEYEEKGSPPNPKVLVRTFRHLMKDLARAGLDVNSLLTESAQAQSPQTTT